MTHIKMKLSGDPRSVIRSGIAIYGSNSLSYGTPKDLPGGASITLEPALERRSHFTHDAAPVFEFVLSVGGTVALSVVSNYIYEKLRPHKESVKLTISRRITEIDAGYIERTIEEEIDYERRA
jgi:hypothetical protein